MLKKSLALLLTLCMVLALAPVSVFAAETTGYDTVQLPAKLPKAVNLDGYITQDDGYHAFGIVANNVFTPIAEYSSGNSGKNYVMSDVAEALNDAQTFTYFFAQDDTKYYFGIKLDRKSVNVNGYNYFSSQQDLTFKFGFGSNDKPVTINLPVRNNVSIGTDTYNLKVSDATIKAALVRGVDGSAAKSYFNTEPTYSNPSGLGAGVWSAAMYNNLARVASDNRTIAEGTVIGHSAARAQIVGASVFTYEFSITKASVEAYLGEGSTAPSSIYFSAASTTRYGSMNDLGLTAMAGADSFDSTYSANIQFIDVDADNCEHNYVENPIDSFLVNKSNWVAGNGYYHAIHPTSNTTANSRLRCGQAAEYYKSCSKCRTAGTDTFYGEVKQHSFVIRGNIVSSEVTACNAEKPSRITYEYKCAWCDETAELPLIDYNHNYEVIDGTSKIYSRAYFRCADCGKEAFRQMCGVTTQTSVHTQKTISIPATCYSPLLTVTYCSNAGAGSASVCAYSATEQTGPTKSHTAVLEKEYDASLTQSGNDKNSTCEAGGVYFKTCDVCGAVDQTSETFTTDALGHLDDKYLVPVDGQNFHFTECSRCKGASDNNAKAEHSFSTEYENDDDNHWRECECGAKTDVTPHDTTDDGDCTTAVVCSCGKEVVAKNAEHTPEEDDNDCTTAVKCQNCDKIVIEAEGSHTPEEDDNNCTTEVKCKVCGTVTTEVKEHNFGGEWNKDGSGHWYACQNAGCTITDTKDSHKSSGEATEEADEYCTVCNFVIKAALGHTHEYNTLKYDETNHWMECRCTDKKDVTAHTAKADDGDCMTAITCTDCECVMVAAKVSHDYTGEWKTDATDHWKVCQNTGCTVPNEKEEHTSDADDGDCSTAIKCTVCQYETTAAKTHNFSGEWNKDAEGHWYVCQNAGCKVEEETKTEHTPADDDNNCATEVKCTACGYVTTEVKAHSFKATSDKVADEATCTTNAYNFYKCENCNVISDTEKYEVEDTNLGGHDVEGVELTAGKKPTTCMEIGWTEYRVCKRDNCGAKVGYKEYTLRWPVGTVTPINKNLDHTALTYYGQNVYTTGANYTATTEMTIDGKIDENEGWVCVTPGYVDKTYVQTITAKYTGYMGSTGSYVATPYGKGGKKPGTDPVEYYTDYEYASDIKYYVAKKNGKIYVAIEDYSDFVDLNGNGVFDQYTEGTTRNNYSLYFGFNSKDSTQLLYMNVNATEKHVMNWLCGTPNSEIDLSGDLIAATLTGAASAKYKYEEGGVAGNLITNYAANNNNTAQNNMSRWIAQMEFEFDIDAIKAAYAAVGVTLTDADFNSIFLGLGTSMFINGTSSAGSVMYGTLLTKTDRDNNGLSSTYIPDIIVFGEEKDLGCNFADHVIDARYLASENEDGTKSYYHSCTFCGAAGARTFNVSAEGVILYEKSNYDETNHWNECICGEKVNVTQHTAAADDNNCATEVKCTGCDKVMVAAKAHNFSGDWSKDADGHWYVCQNTGCTVADTKASHESPDDDNNCATEVKCTVCEFVTTESQAHNFSGEWNKDAEGHWYVCQNEGCAAAETKVAHTPGAEATETEAQKCTVCEWVITPATGHSHEYNVPNYDETNHWNECECGEKADVTPHTTTDDGDCTTAVVCSCGKEMVAANATHTPAEDDKNCATEVKCTVCGTVTTSAKAHDFGGEYKTDADGHWYVCQNEGCEIADTKATHTPGAAANCTDDQVCTVCQFVTDTAKGHTFDVAEEKAEYLVEGSVANCTTGASYYKHCVCGEISKTETFESEVKDMKNHKYSTKFFYDDTYHWNECTRCGATNAPEMHQLVDGDCVGCNYIKVTDVPTPGVTPTPGTDTPTTDVPTTDVPTTDVPTTDVPETEIPTTDVPETEVPTTDVPETTEVPTTEEPTTEEPTTEVPATDEPTDEDATEVPTTETPAAEEGCKESISLAGLAIVTMLGTCAVFVTKKKED